MWIRHVNGRSEVGKISLRREKVKSGFAALCRDKVGGGGRIRPTGGRWGSVAAKGCGAGMMRNGVVILEGKGMKRGFALLLGFDAHRATLQASHWRFAPLATGGRTAAGRALPGMIFPGGRVSR
jgi:hypothetical protein